MVEGCVRVGCVMVGGVDDTGGCVMVGGVDDTGGCVMVGGVDDTGGCVIDNVRPGEADGADVGEFEGLTSGGVGIEVACAIDNVKPGKADGVGVGIDDWLLGFTVGEVVGNISVITCVLVTNMGLFVGWTASD